VEPKQEKGASRPWRIDESVNSAAPAPRPATFLGECGSGTEGFDGARASGGRTDGRARTAAASAGCDGGGRQPHRRDVRAALAVLCCWASIRWLQS
jgi:hypothetical protein